MPGAALVKPSRGPTSPPIRGPTYKGPTFPVAAPTPEEVLAHTKESPRSNLRRPCFAGLAIGALRGRNRYFHESAPATSNWCCTRQRRAGARWRAEFSDFSPVCRENLIRVDDVMESPKLAEWLGCSVSFWSSWPRHSSRSCGLKLRTRCFDIS
jgi:hypothetical protein